MVWFCGSGIANLISMTSKIIWILLIVLISESAAGRYWYQKSRNVTGQCQCNHSEIFTELPYVLQELRQNEKFDWIFQGKKGDRGADGPQGPAGLPGKNGEGGSKGERGEAGPRGLPGTTQVFSPKGSFFGNGYGEKGSMGSKGMKGQKGESGQPLFSTVLKDGSYVQVKGEKGGRGRRGKRGLAGEEGAAGKPGNPGLSIEGPKGQKGEPAQVPDIELLRGLPGLRGPPGLPGYPGIGCHEQFRNSEGQGSSCGLPSLIVQRKGEPGEPGRPGVSLFGEKGEPGPQGPPGPPGSLPESIVGVHSFTSKREMLSQKHLVAGAIAFVTSDDRAYVKVSTGWKEIPLSPTLTTTSNDSEQEMLPRVSKESFNSVHHSFEDGDGSSKVAFLRNPSIEKRRYWRRNSTRGRRKQ